MLSNINNLDNLNKITKKNIITGKTMTENKNTEKTNIEIKKTKTTKTTKTTKKNKKDKLLYDVDKVTNTHINLINSYFSKDSTKEHNFYINNYNTVKYIDIYPTYKNIILKDILNNTTKSNIFKNNILTFAYFDLYQLYFIEMDTVFNKDNLKIAEISVLPSMFEVLEKKNKIDVYLTKDNYRNLDEPEWKDIINYYKKVINKNIYYESKINKKYDILIINLINIENNEFNQSTIIKYIKEEIKMLKHLEKGGSCYIYFNSIINTDLLKLYLDLCKKFEKIDFFIAKYRDEHSIYGGLWLKCYNYKCKNKTTIKELKSKIELFNTEYYDKKYKWYLEYEKYLEEYFNKNKDDLKLKNDIEEIQVNTCKSFIEEYKIEIKPEWKSFLYGDFYIKQSFKQINYRSIPSLDYNDIFRILPEDGYGYLPYGILGKSFNCHDGQRKLLYSEIEFYSLVREKYNLNNILVVYVGSANGIHEPVIFDLFPEFDFYLCDPNPYMIHHPLIRNKERVCINNDYYTDETWNDVVAFNKKKKDIVFICDIREDMEEQAILNNMIQQQLWTVQLNSVAYMLKFRLPYLVEENFKKLNLNYKLPDGIKVDKKLLDSSNKSIYDFLYLKGDIYFQIYAPIMSSETRLIHVKDNKKDLFEIKKYSIDAYDGNLYYFNMVDRSKKYEYKDSRLMKYHLLGYDDSYESVSEYYIINKYLEENEKDIKYSDIIRKIYEINNKIIQYSHKDIVLCQFYTRFKDKQAFIISDYNYKYSNNINLKKSKIQDMIDTFKNLYILLLFSLVNQYYYFGKGNILTYNDYEKQRINIKEQFKKINKYIDDMINKELVKKDTKYIIIKDMLNKADNMFTKLFKNNNQNNSKNISKNISITNKYLNLFNSLYKKL